MKIKYLKILIYLLGIIIFSSSYIYIKHRNVFDIIVNHDFYDYKYFCKNGSKQCLTVISYTPIKISDNISKRFVVYGKKVTPFLFFEKYVEYPNETGLYVEWISFEKCIVISNLPAINVMKLTNKIDIEFTYDNQLYEKNSDLHPDYSL